MRTRRVRQNVAGQNDAGQKASSFKPQAAANCRRTISLKLQASSFKPQAATY